LKEEAIQITKTLKLEEIARITKTFNDIKNSC
jgi:hypothetical protein